MSDLAENPEDRFSHNEAHITLGRKMRVYDDVVVLGFYVSPTAKVIRRRDLGLKSHPKD